MYVRAYNDAILFVTCPYSIKDSEIYEFIRENEERIRKNILKEKQKRAVSKIYSGGEFFYVFGERRQIDKNQNINKLYQDLNKRLLIVANNYLNKYRPILLDYGYYKEPVLKIRKMKTKWGVCYTQKNTICLSTYLVHYPSECIEYIVLHELCHFIVPNHSKRFYALIEARIPDYKEKTKQLI